MADQLLTLVQLPLPINPCNLRIYILVAIPPVNPHPLPWVGTSKDENAGKDENGWLKVGITEVYYNYYFENFPVANWQDGSLFIQVVD